jgi:HAMP domain-containing protein
MLARGLAVLRYMGAVFLLGLLPVVFFSLFMEKTFREEFLVERREGEQFLRKYVQIRMEMKTSIRQINGIVGGYFYSAVGNPDGLQRVIGMMADLKQRFPGVFEFALFDKDNRLVPEHSDLPEFHDRLASAAQDFQAMRCGDPKPFLSKRTWYQPLFGTLFLPRPKEYGGHLNFQVRQERHRSHFFTPWIGANSPWIMVWISLPENTEELSLNMLLNFIPERDSGVVSGLVDLSRPFSEAQGAFEEAGKGLTAAMLELGSEMDRVVAVDGFLWANLFSGSRTRLVVCFPDKGERNYQGKMRLLVRWGGGGVGVLFLLALFLFRRIENWTLQSKLVLLFLYSAAMPISLLALAAHSLCLDRGRMLEKRLFSEQFEILQVALRKALERVSLLEEMAHRSLGRKIAPDVTGEALSEEFNRRISPKFPPDSICFIDERGKTVVKVGSGYRSLVEKTLPLVGPMIGNRIIEVNGRDPSPGDIAREQMVLATLEMMGIEPRELVGFFDPPDTFQSVQIGATKSGVMGHRVFEQGGILRFVGVGIWGNEAMQATLGSAFLHFQDRISRMIVASPSYPHERWRECPFSSLLVARSIQISNTGLVIREKLSHPEGNWLLTGIPGNQMFPWPVLALASDQPIRAEIRLIIRDLVAIALLVLGMALVGGVLSSRHFLKPIRELSVGLAGVKARNFTTRVPIRGEDEFSELVGAFNRMVEGMADLEVGRIVQETFFPQGPLFHAGWGIAGISMSAGRVGGDYFDYFLLPDGRMLIMIGDVSGHGVAAALVVAMAKALTTFPGNPQEPGKLLEILNQGLVKTLQRRRLMSCLIGVFDPESGTLTLANGGHNYPYRISGKACTHLDVKGRLLGIKTGISFPQVEVKLGEGDWMCFYTDGLIEALASDGTQIGYEQAASALPELRCDSAPETAASVWRWFRRLTGESALDDDVTIMVLQPGCKSEDVPPL